MTKLSSLTGRDVGHNITMINCFRGPPSMTILDSLKAGLERGPRLGGQFLSCLSGTNKALYVAKAPGTKSEAMPDLANHVAFFWGGAKGNHK